LINNLLWFNFNVIEIQLITDVVQTKKATPKSRFLIF